MSGMTEHIEKLILDGTKIAWHDQRVRDWADGKRIAPITIDMALTRACNYGCHYCYAMLQENDRSIIDKKTITQFLEDRKSTRLNSSHSSISYAVFCLKKKKLVGLAQMGQPVDVLSLV